MTVRKDDKSLMPSCIGQSVLKRKAKLSLDASDRLEHTVPMGDRESESLFKQEFTERIKSARIARGMKQWEMAHALDIPQDKYKQYEGRSLMPHHMIGRFCLITRIDPNWLLTGRGEKPIQPIRPVPAEPPVMKPKPKPKRGKNAA